ncbi:MAG: Ig-like domain-containing protein [Phycisphaeraceae bacterium]
MLAAGVGHDAADAASGVVGVDTSGLANGTYTVVARIVANDIASQTPDYSKVTIEPAGSGITGYNVLWGIDEDDNTLFGVWDISDPVSTFVDFGPLHVDDNGSIVPLYNRPEAIAVGTDGIAYVVSNDTVAGVAGPVLLRIDTNALDPAQDAVAEVIGRIPVPTLTSGYNAVSGLDFDSQGNLYGLYLHSQPFTQPAQLFKLTVTEDPGGSFTIEIPERRQLVSHPANTIVIEAEQPDTITSPMQTHADSDFLASNGGYLEVAPGNNAWSPPSTAGIASYQFTTAQAGNHYFWGKVIAEVTQDDSFWVKIDSGDWIEWNGLSPINEWTWSEIYDHDLPGDPPIVMNFGANEQHTIHIAYREDGTKLDQLLITPDSSYNPAASTSQILGAEDMSFDRNDNLVVSDRETDKVYKIDKSTGQILGEFDCESFTHLEGIAFNPANDELLVSERGANNARSVGEGAAPNSDLFRLSFFGITDAEALDFQTTTSQMPDRRVYFLPDEDDGELGAVWNIDHDATSQSSLGLLMAEDTPGNFLPLSGVEPIAIDTNATAYLVHSGTIGSSTGVKLYKLDLADAANDAVQVVEYIGTITTTASRSVPGLAFHPVTQDLYGILRRSDETVIDQLIKIDTADASILETHLLESADQTIAAERAQGISFSPNGATLYVSDIYDNDIYSVDPTDGTITAVYDNDPFNGLTTHASQRVLALETDGLTGDLFASESAGDRVLDLDAGNGGNQERFVYPTGITEAEGLGYYPNLAPAGTTTGGGTSLTPPPITGPEHTIAPNPARPSYSALDTDTLQDVTTKFELEYRHTSANQHTGDHFVGVRITKGSAIDVRDQLMLVIDGPDNAKVDLINAQGVLPVDARFSSGGSAYIEVGHLLSRDDNGFFEPSSQNGELTLRFRYTGDGQDDFTQRDRFDYTLALHGSLNQAPTFVTDPYANSQGAAYPVITDPTAYISDPSTGKTLQIAAGQTLSYHAVADDPEEDDVTYSLVLGSTSAALDPDTGTLDWTTSADDIGTRTFRLRATDQFGRYDAANDQLVRVRVVPAIGNHAPQFQTDPILQAVAGQPYTYDSDATDPDNDTLTYSFDAALTDADDPPASDFAVNPTTGQVTWTPDPSLIGQTFTAALTVTDNNGGTDTQDYTIQIIAGPENNAPVIISEPPLVHKIPASPNLSNGDVTPTSLVVDVPTNETTNKTVSITLPSTNTIDKVDVFLLFDDTGSFASTSNTLISEFPTIISDVETSLPGVSFGYGIGRFEDYSNFAGEYPEGRPFTLNQPIIVETEVGSTPFQDAIDAALGRNAPGNGGDGPESLIEALYQVATGAGFDHDDDGDTDGSGPAGLVSTQISPGSDGDVPAFSSFTSDPANNVLAPAGTLGGVGFRDDALPIILVATDIGTVYQGGPSHPDPISGASGVIVPLSEFQTYAYRETTPNNAGATIQDAVNELVNLGALVIGLGDTYAFEPRPTLEALARLTGSVNGGTSTIDSGIANDEILPGDPLYFDINPGSGSNVADGIVSAIEAAVISTAFDIEVVPSDENITISSIAISPTGTAPNLHVAPGVGAGDTATFDIQLIGDGQAHSFDLHFVRAGTQVLLGSIPVTLNASYEYDVDAIDPDGDVLTYELIGETYGATIDSQTGEVYWPADTTGSYALTAKVTDPHGASDTQAWTLDIDNVGTGNTAPVVTSTVPDEATAGIQYQYQIVASDPDGDHISHYLLPDTPEGLTVDADGLLSWTPSGAQIGTNAFTIRVTDGQPNGFTDHTVTIEVGAEEIDNTVPIFTTSGRAIVVVGEVYRYPAQAYDAEGDPITYQIVSGPAGMAMDADSGQLVWSPEEGDVGNQQIVIRATDTRGLSSVQSYTLRVLSNNIAPEIISDPHGPARGGSSPETYIYQVVASDENGDALRYTLVDGPAGMTLDQTGLLTWTPGVAGDYFVRIRVEDGRGGVDEQRFVLPVNETNAGPTLGLEPLDLVFLDELWQVKVLADDPDGVLMLDSFSLSQAAEAAGVELVDIGGEFFLQWTPTALGTVSATLTVTDAGGASSSVSLTLPVNVKPVVNELPELENAPLGPAVADRAWSFVPRVSDPNNDEVDVTLVDGPAWLSGSTVDGVFQISGTPSEGGTVSFTIQLQDLDAYGDSTPVLLSFDLPVLDNAPPFILSAPLSARLENGVAWDAVFEVIDANADIVLVELIGNPSANAPVFSSLNGTAFSDDPNNPTSVTMTFTPDTLGDQVLRVRLTDSFGNAVTHDIEIFVYDSQAPNLSPSYAFTARQSIAVGQPFVAQVNGSDPEREPLTYGLLDESGAVVTELTSNPVGGRNSPVGMRIDPGTGLISWTPGEADVTADPTQPYAYVVTVSDGTNPPVYDANNPATLSVYRQFINGRPQIDDSRVEFVRSGDSPVELVYLPTATDPDNDTLSWAIIEGPDTVTIDERSGEVVWRPRGDEGDLTQRLVIAASDPYGELDTQGIDLVNSITVKHAPRIVSTPTSYARAGVGNQWVYVIEADDKDNQDLTFALEGALAGQPSNIVSLDKVTNSDNLAVLTWNDPGESSGPLFDVNDEIAFTVVVTDPDGLSARQRITLTRDTTTVGEEVAITSEPTYAVMGGESYRYQVTAEGSSGFSYAIASATDVTDAANLVDLTPQLGGLIDTDGLIDWSGTGADATDDYLNKRIEFTVVVTGDDLGAKAFQTFVIGVGDPSVTNNAPTIQTLTGLSTAADEPLVFDVIASDPEGEPLTFHLIDFVPAPDPQDPDLKLLTDVLPAETDLGEVRIDPNGRVTWTPDPNEVGPRSVTVRVTDAGGAYSEAVFSLGIAAATDDPPIVSLRVEDTTPRPGQVLVFAVAGWDDGSLVDLYVELSNTDLFGTSGLKIPVGADGIARYLLDSGVTSGTITAVATARDDANQSSSTAPVQLTITPTGSSETIINIASPSPGTPIESVTQIIGQVSDSDGLTSLVVSLIPISDNIASNSPVEIFRDDNGTVADIGLISPETIATINPLAIADGSYTVQVEATDSSGTTTTRSFPVTIASQGVKLGNFALSFTDMTAPVAGIPITLQRSYDTLDAGTLGDFGYGWSMELLSGEVQVGNLAGDDLISSDDFLKTTFQTPWQFGTTLDFELPGGEKMSFVAAANSYTTQGGIGRIAGGLFSGAGAGYSVVFLPQNAQALGVKLEFAGGGQEVVLDDNNADQAGLRRNTRVRSALVNVGPDGALTTSGTPFSPLTYGYDYRLTTRDGYQYTFDSASGELRSVTDPYRNTLEIRGDDITSSDHTGQVDAQIHLKRDQLGRITEVTDLFAPEDGSIRYEYDPATGDLIKVTDRSGVETEYRYGEDHAGVFANPDDFPDHVLTTIVNGSGVEIAEMSFDQQGRLAGIRDASGATAPFTYQLDPAQFGLPSGYTVESVSDDNDVPTEIVRDGRGNTLATVQRTYEDTSDITNNQYLVTAYRYDADDNQTHASFAYTQAHDTRLTHPVLDLITDPNNPSYDPTVWASITTYDHLQRVTSTTDATGLRTTYSGYDRLGNPTTIQTFEPGQSTPATTTVNQFTNGRLTRTVDALGNATAYDYDADGNLRQLTQYDGDNNAVVLSTYGYDDRGRLTSVTDAHGVTRRFIYDNAGRQTHAWWVWTDPTDPANRVTLVTVTQYDKEGRTKAASQYTLAQSYADDAAVLAALTTATADWSTSTTYDATGQVTATTDQYNTLTTNTYDARGQLIETLTEAEDASGDLTFVATRSVYDNNGRLIYATDAFDLNDTTAEIRGTQTIYDPLGRVTETRRIEHLDVQLSTDPLDPTAETSSVVNLGSLVVLSVTKTRYDDRGRVYETESETGLVTRYGYDAAGRQETVTIDPGDTFGLLATTTYTYDGQGRQASVTDALGRVMEYEYDALGRVVATRALGDAGTPGDDLVTRTAYDYAGRRIAETDALGRRTGYSYDETGRLTGVTLPELTDAAGTGSTAGVAAYAYGYDAYGNQTSITDPIGTSTTGIPDDRETTFTFDHRNRQITRTLPDGLVESMHYDDTPVSQLVTPASSTGVGQLAYMVDFEGNVTGYLYDNTATGRGRMVEKAYYDAADISATITTSMTPGQITAALAGVTSQRVVTYTYDAFGRAIETKIDRDPANPGTDLHETTNAYDAEGRLIQVDSPEGVINHEYDDLGRLTHTYTGTKSSTPVSDAGYTPTASDGIAVTHTEYTYDALGRLASVIVREREDTPLVTPEITTYAYDAAGAQDYEHSSVTGVTKDVVYDSLGRPTELNHFQDADADGVQDAGEHTVAKFTYTYDAAGNRTTAFEQFDQDADGTFDQAQKFTWTYDGLNRLVVETFDSGDGGTTLDTDTASDYVTRYAFDLASNRRLMEKVTGSYTYNPGSFTADETVTYNYDDNDRLTDEVKVDHNNSANDRNTIYTYDGTTQTGKTVREGSTLGSGTVVETQTQTYNAMGRMDSITVTKDGSTTVTEYEYDNRGLRVKATETVDGGTPKVTEYLFEGNNHTGYAQTLEEMVDGSLDKTFTLGHDVLAQVAAAEVLTLLYDLHGSTRALIDTSGQIKNDANPDKGLQAFSFDAYGNMLATGFGAAAATNALTNLLYSGEFTNAITGLQYLRARFYDPSSGRFNRSDPFAGVMSDPLSLHKYLYTHGNPTMGTDPSGMAEFSLVAKITVGAIITSIAASFVSFGLREAGFTNAADRVEGFSRIANGVAFLGLAPALFAGNPALGVAGIAAGLDEIAVGGRQLLFGGRPPSPLEQFLQEAGLSEQQAKWLSTGFKVGIAIGPQVKVALTSLLNWSRNARGNTSFLRTAWDAIRTEFGKTTVSDDAWKAIENLNPVERASWIARQIRTGNVSIFSPHSLILGFGKTFSTGPTPAGMFGLQFVRSISMIFEAAEEDNAEN